MYKFRYIKIINNLKMLCFLSLFLFTMCNAQNTSQTGFDEKRKTMVRNQIQWRGINNRQVLEAMLKVPRHKFVPDMYIEYAYEDTPLPIGDGQTISQPYIVAFMTDELELKPSDKVLEIGTGSGYQAAVLAEICETVYTIEIFESLGLKAKKLLDEMGYNNIKVKIGDGYQGWEEYGPFDAIIVTCSPKEIPQPLKDQLAEGGRMIIPIGKKYTQELVLLRKKNGKIKQHAILPVRFVPMINEFGNEY